MTDEERGADDLGWWVIHGETLLEALRRAHRGEDPDLLYAELYANTETEFRIVGDDDGDG